MNETDNIVMVNETLGGHVHVRIFVNGALSGKLIVRTSEEDALYRINDIANQSNYEKPDDL